MKIRNVCIEIKFYIVLDDTMIFDVLFDRDFLAIHITLGKTMIVGAVEADAVDQIMHIGGHGDAR